MNAASPWDALMRRSVVRRLPQPTAEAAESSKTQMLLYAIDQLGHVTTMRLCLETDLDSRAVWGLLKQHRKSGRVRFMCGEWSPGVSAASIKAEQAATLLRSLGWTVVEPAGLHRKDRAMTEWDLAYMRRRVQPTDADLSAENARLREQLALAETVRASQVAGLTDGLAKLREEVVRLTKIIDDAWGEA